MPDPLQMNPQDLYKQWRSGDPAAGQAMAQRFSDWYYSLISVRLGDIKGRQPLQRACLRFQQGISTVASPSELVDWSHQIILEEMKGAGERIDGGDFPNQLTGGRSPGELLRQVARTLPPEDMSLLAHTFDSRYPLEALTEEARARGGMPLAILRARYALKHALREHAGIPFQEVPAEPNLDYVPLPLYESGRMAGTREEAGFEKWVLSNMTICRDVAEFGVFALALRTGALRQGLSPRPAESRTGELRPEPPLPRPEPAIAPPRHTPSPVRSDAPVLKSSPGTSAVPIALIAGGIGGVVVLIILAYLLYSMMG